MRHSYSHNFIHSKLILRISAQTHEFIFKVLIIDTKKLFDWIDTNKIFFNSNKLNSCRLKIHIYLTAKGRAANCFQTLVHGSQYSTDLSTTLSSSPPTETITWAVPALRLKKYLKWHILFAWKNIKKLI